MTPDATSSWDWFPVLLWPVTIACILLGTMIARAAAPRSLIRTTIVPVVLMLPAPFLFRYLLYNSSQSLVHLFDYYLLFVIAGALFCATFAYFFFSPMPGEAKAVALVICGLAGPYALVLGLNPLVQDYLLSRLVVDGKISRLAVASASRKATEYQVTIETMRFWATPEIFERLRQGERVRAEIGKGSRYIYRIAQIPNPG